MAFDAESLGLKAGPIALLRDLIRDRLGVHYADDRLDSLADRLAPLVAERGFGSFLDYFYLLKYDPLSEDEWDRVMDTLSVGETWTRLIRDAKLISSSPSVWLSASLRRSAARGR